MLFEQALAIARRDPKLIITHDIQLGYILPTGWRLVRGYPREMWYNRGGDGWREENIKGYPQTFGPFLASQLVTDTWRLISLETGQSIEECADWEHWPEVNIKKNLDGVV